MGRRLATENKINDRSAVETTRFIALSLVERRR